MNDVEITVRGNITSDVRRVEFDDGNVLTSFRLACNVRKWDAALKENVTLYTTWYTVNCRRALGRNVMESLQKGQPVLVHGRLKQQRWSKDERNGETSLIDAMAIGHDLTFGTAAFSKLARVERLTENGEQVSQAVAAVMAAELDELAADEAQLLPDPWGPSDLPGDDREEVPALA